jgi:hypothetical protein
LPLVTETRLDTWLGRWSAAAQGHEVLRVGVQGLVLPRDRSPGWDVLGFALAVEGHEHRQAVGGEHEVVLRRRIPGSHVDAHVHALRSGVEESGLDLHQINPGRYDYRRAAVEALLFPRLFDRWVQNLRRCAGCRVQYFGAIEAQRRLTPHIHLAIRGAIPWQLIKQVTGATYAQVWWPRFDEPVHIGEMPVWDRRTMSYVDRSTGVVLPTWEEAVDELGEPSAVLRFGMQLDWSRSSSDEKWRIGGEQTPPPLTLERFAQPTPRPSPGPSAPASDGTRDRHDVHDPVEAGEVIGVGRVER